MSTVDAHYTNELAVATYDLRTASFSGATAGDVAFYKACARQFGDPVLELAVGTGRVAWQLADAGLRVVGVDLSAAMLEQAARNGAGRPAAVRERVTLHQADMAAFVLAAAFPLAIIPYSAFQHLLTPERQRSALACIHRHLIPDGHLVVDVFDPLLEHCIPGAASPMPDPEAIEPASGHLIRRRTIARHNDPINQTIAETFRLEVVSASGEVIEETETSFAVRWACRQEMAYLFELSGFEVVEQYSDFDRAPPAYGKRQIWVVRRR
jgi:SAM-dependent methyltransferase